MPRSKEVKTAKIIVAKIYEPSGAGPYRIFDKSARQYWKVWKDKLDELNLQEGGTYSVMYNPGTYTNPATGKTTYDNVIIGAQSIDTTVATQQPLPLATPSREMDITVNGLTHCPRLVELAEAGDRVTIALILDTLEEGWKLHKGLGTEALKAPPAQREGSDSQAEFSDEIPY